MPEHTWRSPHQINNSERETRKNRRGSERKREKTDEWCLPVAAPFNHLSLFCMCIFLLPSFIPAGPVLHLVCDKWPTSFVPSSLHSSSCLFVFVFSSFFLLFFLKFFLLFSCSLYIFSPGWDRSIRGASACRRSSFHSCEIVRRKEREE